MNEIIAKTELLYQKSKPNDQLSLKDGINLMVNEQKNAARDVKKGAKSIECAINKVVDHLTLYKKGRLIYVGAGTSGRIGIQNEVELFPTFLIGPEIG
jgi:N-acetylmuramic acid 6-phosphate etherase